MWKHVCPRISALVIGLVVGGCSTLEVQDAYRPIGNETALLDYKIDDVELRVGINPDTRFYSIGVFGVPIIPTYFKTADSTELALGIGLTLRHDHNFSFALRPCLTIENSSTFCPYELEVSAVGMFRDDGSMYADKQKRWQKISNFYSAENRILSLPTEPESGRVSRERIYQHYSYTGYRKWDYLRIDLTYKYKCEGTCPERLNLDVKDLVIVKNVPIPNGIYSFEKTRQKNYRFLTPVQ